MIAVIIIGWAVALPLCVVVGLFCAAKVLGRRARTSDAPTVGTDMTAFARQFPVAPDGLVPVGAPDQRVTRSLSADY